MRAGARANGREDTPEDDPRGAESDESDDYMLQEVRQLHCSYEIPAAASDW